MFIAGRGEREPWTRTASWRACPRHWTYLHSFASPYDSSCCAARPGRAGALDEDSQLVGVPSYVPSAPADTPAEYYFVIISEDSASEQHRASGQLARNMQASSAMRALAADQTISTSRATIAVLCT